jgi:hypothetical protein
VVNMKVVKIAQSEEAKYQRKIEVMRAKER